MSDRLTSMVTVAIAAAAVSAAISVLATRTSAQAPAFSNTALETAPLKTAPLKTAWGEPDLQGIWPLNQLVDCNGKIGTSEFLEQGLKT